MGVGCGYDREKEGGKVCVCVYCVYIFFQLGRTQCTRIVYAHAVAAALYIVLAAAAAVAVSVMKSDSLVYILCTTTVKEVTQ